MNDLIEEGMSIEKKFKNKCFEIIKNEIPEEVKVELISVAGAEYFSDKLKMMVKFYEENKDVQKALASEKVEKELENYQKRKEIEALSKKETDVINCIVKNKTWATTAIISRETNHTWMTVDKYIQNFIKLGYVEIVKTNMTRKKRYQMTKDYKFLYEEL